MKLIEIDLSKTTRDGSDKLTVGPTYLCRIFGKLYAGTFTKQWYRLSFNGWINPAGIQYDPPGTNSSSWDAIWLIDENPRTKLHVGQRRTQVARRKTGSGGRRK